MSKSTNNKKRCFDHLEPGETAPQPFAVVKKRKNDFNEQTWWMVDLDCPTTETIRQGATPLVKRCMRNYGWDLDHTKKILKAYRQFLILTREHQDWEATILSPSPFVNQMWHQHVLDTGNYYHDMILLCGGKLVLYNPDHETTTLNHCRPKKKSRRHERTLMELIQKFGSKNVDHEIWVFPSILPTSLTMDGSNTTAVESPPDDGIDSEDSWGFPPPESVSTMDGSNTAESSPDGEIIESVVQEDPSNNNRQMVANAVPPVVTPRTCMGNNNNNNNSNNNNNKVITGATNGSGYKPRTLPLGNSKTSKASYGKIEIVVQDPSNNKNNRMAITVTRRTFMNKVFLTYANHYELNVSRLCFFYNGKRIRKDDTPRRLGLKDGDVIDMMIPQQPTCMPKKVLMTIPLDKSSNTAGESSSKHCNNIKIVVQDSSNNNRRQEVTITGVSPKTFMNKVMDRYANHYEIMDASSRLGFFYKGKRIRKDDTPRRLDLQDGDAIEMRRMIPSVAAAATSAAAHSSSTVAKRRMIQKDHDKIAARRLDLEGKRRYHW